MNMYRLSLLSKIFLQAGITKGDYEAAGISGQLNVVTLDTYNESEGQTSDTSYWSRYHQSDCAYHHCCHHCTPGCNKYPHSYPVSVTFAIVITYYHGSI